jgi:hypothetical protein
MIAVLLAISMGEKIVPEETYLLYLPLVNECQRRKFIISVSFQKGSSVVSGGAEEVYEECFNS